jgi:hypothetical protein
VLEIEARLGEKLTDETRVSVIDHEKLSTRLSDKLPDHTKLRIVGIDPIHRLVELSDHFMRADWIEVEMIEIFQEE